MHRSSIAIAITVLALLLYAGTADARIGLRVEEGPAVPRGARVDLPFSQFPERSTAGGHRYDLYCPHTTEPNPLVIVALDVQLSLERAEPIAQRFARAGLIAVVVEPAPDLAAYLPRITAVLDEVLAAAPLEARDPGCERTGAVAAWGAGRGGVAVVELARARASAGQPMAAVVTVYAGTAYDLVAGVQAPLLEVEAREVMRQDAPRMRSLVVHGGQPCFLSWQNDPCRHREVPERAALTGAIYYRSSQFIHAFVDGDAAARAVFDRRDAEVFGELPSPPAPSVSNRSYLLFSLPLLFGGISDADIGFYYGIRPELVLARIPTREDRTVGRGFGCGLYGELVRWSGDSVFGAGVTCVAYLGRYAVAPSAGVASRPAGNERDGAVAAGVFFGFRGWDDRLGSTDDPVGIRIDGHFGYDAGKDRVIMVSAAFDLTIVAQVISAFGALASP